MTSRSLSFALGALLLLPAWAVAEDEPPVPAEAPPAEPGAALVPAEAPPKFLVDRLAAGASFGYYSSDSLRYLSSLDFDFPFLVIRQRGAYIRGSLSSSISRIDGLLHSDNFSFRVEDVDYLFEAGARDYLTPRIALAAFAGQQGSENLDRPGSAWIRYFGLGAQTATFPRPGGEKRLDWNINAGRIFSRGGLPVDADWRFEGDLLWDAIRLDRSSVGLDLNFDTLLGAGDWHSDWRLGPRWSFDLENGIRASLFARYIHSRNPLGVGTSGWNIGLDYREGAHRAPRSGRFPDVRGTLAIGAGADRSPARFDLEADFPSFSLASRSATVFLASEADTLWGRGPDSIRFSLRAGLDLDLPRDLTGCLMFEHRSYHRLSETISSDPELNLFYAGVRSNGWDWDSRTTEALSPRGEARWPGRLEWTGRAGGLISSTDVSRANWYAAAGARWDLPGPRPGYTPFLLAEIEQGAAHSSRYAAGITLPTHMAITGEFRRDDDLPATDKSEYMLVAHLFY